MKTARRRRIGRPCVDCGRPTASGSRCPSCAEPVEAARQARQIYRAAYASPEYRTARRQAMRAAGGRCVRILPTGERCPARAQETNHRIPLSTAQTVEEAIALCRAELLEPVCFPHHPRGLVET